MSDKEPTGQCGDLAPSNLDGNSTRITPSTGISRVTSLAKRAYNTTLIIAAAAAVAYQSSPLNEELRVRKGFEELVRTGSPLAVGWQTFWLTAAIEVVPATLIALSLSGESPIIKKPVDRFKDWKKMGRERERFRYVSKKDQSEVGEDDTCQHPAARNNPVKGALNRVGGVLADAGIALGLGAGMLVVSRDSRNNNPSRAKRFRENLLSGLGGAALIGAVSGAIGYFIAGGTKQAQLSLPILGTVHFEQQAQWLIDYGTDTKAIIGALVLLQAPGIIKKLYHRLPRQEEKFQKWLQENSGN